MTANDFLTCCAVMTKAILLNDGAPEFRGLREAAPEIFAGESTRSPYERVLAYLNRLEGREGFIYGNYSPASLEQCEYERMYFTRENARKIDDVRETIAEWSGLLEEREEALLIADLLFAVSAVSNIAGTYGCYIKPLWLTPRRFTAGGGGHTVWNCDANELVGRVEAPIIYADPPYTKRQYSAYYHILETIARNDRPEIGGKTRLRNWKEHSSRYCYRRSAGKALEELLERARCQYFFLSYNSDGQIPHEEIRSIMARFGETRYWEVPYKRYKSNSAVSRKPPLTERLYLADLRERRAALTRDGGAH